MKNKKYPMHDWLTGFIYTLMRDCVPPGEMERIVKDIENTHKISNKLCVYSNGYLAKYSKELSDRIRKVI